VTRIRAALGTESPAADAPRPVTVSAEIARALAGATDFGDLIRETALCLGLSGTRRDAARLWFLSPHGEPEPLVRHPPGIELPPVDTAVISEAVVRGAVRRRGATFLAVGDPRSTLGVLELRTRRPVDPELAREVMEIAGARLTALVSAQRQRELLPTVPLADDAKEIQEVISIFAAQAKQLLEHDRLSIYLLTPDGTALERFAVATSSIVPGEGIVLPLEQVGLTRVVKTNEPLVSADFGVDDRIRGLEDSLIARAGFHGLVSVPLRVGGKPFGLLNFVSKTPGFYNEGDIAVAQQIADEVSVFLQNLRLQYAVRTAVEREAVARERNRVAREFHDTLAQTLSRLAARVAAFREDPALPASGPLAEHAQALLELSDNALDEVRRAIEDMLPSQLEESSLVEAMEHELAQLHRAERIVTSFTLSGDASDLPRGTQIAVFRIFNEAINNVRQHAGATRVTVQLAVDDELRLSIQDNGKGLDSDAVNGSNAFGIEGMRERARSLGGRLVVSSGNGLGANVVLHVPRLHEESPGQPPSEFALPTTDAVTRVVVIDDHPTFREGVRQLLEADGRLRVVSGSGSGSEGREAVRLKRPDVVLLDLNLPDCSGIELARELAALDPAPVIVIMSAFAEEANVAEALRVGARGYVAKSSSPSSLIDAIHTAVGGGTVVTPGFGWPGEPAGDALTERELEILKQLALGKTNAQIGREIHIADKTVERIVATIAAKLGAKNRAHAVARGIAQNLIDVRDV
jgi:signal transduction histidine kinase/DNA-binding NarL/FixJ family response regulator